MGLIVTGARAQIRWGYQSAATVTNWTVTRDDRGWLLTATLIVSDVFRLSQRPLTFEAPHAKGVWIWPIPEPLQMTGATLTARLGPKQES